MAGVVSASVGFLLMSPAGTDSVEDTRRRVPAHHLTAQRLSCETAGWLLRSFDAVDATVAVLLSALSLVVAGLSLGWQVRTVVRSLAVS